MLDLLGYVDLPAHAKAGGTLAPGVPIERWDDVPAVSENYRAAREVIVSRLPALLQTAHPPAALPRG